MVAPELGKMPVARIAEPHPVGPGAYAQLVRAAGSRPGRGDVHAAGKGPVARDDLHAFEARAAARLGDPARDGEADREPSVDEVLVGHHEDGVRERERRLVVPPLSCVRRTRRWLELDLHERVPGHDEAVVAQGVGLCPAEELAALSLIVGRAHEDAGYPRRPRLIRHAPADELRRVHECIDPRAVPRDD